MPLLDPFDVANHWPFVSSHLVGFDDRRRPAFARGLLLLAKQQVVSSGDPVPMSTKRLRLLGMTPGEAGRAWAALSELERRGVVARYRGGGRRADLWSFVSAVSDRWRVQWRWGGREVEMVLAHCICRAGFDVAARSPGQSVAGSAEIDRFRLPPEAHLGFCPDIRAAIADGRAETSESTRENGTSPRGNGAPSHLSPVGRRNPSSSFAQVGEGNGQGTDDEALRILRQAVEESTGGVLWGEPLEELAAVAGRCNGELGVLAERLREDGARTHSPVQVARRAAEHLRLAQGETHVQRAAEIDRDRRRLELLERIEPTELADEEIGELRHLRATLGVDA